MKTDAILSKAESRIVRGYVDGMIGKEITAALCISYNTVIRHTQNIYKKIGRRTINALVSWWFCTNFDIDLSEVGRCIGAACLLLLFCAYTFDGNNELMVRRARSICRTEVEFLTEE